MKYLKSFIISLSLIMITGCEKYDYEVNTINYNLNIDTSYHENIIFTLPKNAYDLAEQNKNEDYTSLEYSLLNQDNEPIFSNHTEKYKKKITKSLNKINVTLDYNYIEDDFLYSNYIMNCFENYELTSNEDSFEIKLSGEFLCLNDKDITINITSDYDIIETNGTKIDNKYTWKINKDNYNNISIYHIISRDYNNMEQTISKEKNNSLEIIKSIFGIIIVIIILLILIKFYKKKQQES